MKYFAILHINNNAIQLLDLFNLRSFIYVFDSYLWKFIVGKITKFIRIWYRNNKNLNSYDF